MLPHKEIFRNLEIKKTILVEDGKINLKVISIQENIFITEVQNEGIIESNKGINLPDINLETSPLTKKDLLDLEFALRKKIDYVALSFVQRASDIIEAQAIIKERAFIISKIEKPQALNDIDSIIQLSDAIMIARGDLGVEMPPQDLPAIQKSIINKCRTVGKPVIIATQMLESMISKPSSTRAEASDVAGAVFDGADAIMLSGETAMGKYPLEATKIMVSIAKSAESYIIDNPNDGPGKLKVEPSIYHAVAESTVRLAEKIEASAIIAFTASGNTAIRIARERPYKPILVFTPYLSVERRLSLVWGVKTINQSEKKYEKAVDDAIKKIIYLKIANKGDNIVLVSGMPFGLEGSTNAIRVIKL